MKLEQTYASAFVLYTQEMPGVCSAVLKELVAIIVFFSASVLKTCANCAKSSFGCPSSFFRAWADCT